MNYKEILLSTIRGAATEEIPFVPRLDIWYKANKQNGTLPDKYKKADLIDITDDLNIGYHAVMPDFRDYADDNGDIDLGLGIYKFKTIPYNIELDAVKGVQDFEAVAYIYENIEIKPHYDYFLQFKEYLVREA